VISIGLPHRCVEGGAQVLRMVWPVSATVMFCDALDSRIPHPPQLHHLGAEAV